MLKGLPTLLIVTAVALAIWMVAEAESVRTEPAETVVAIESAAIGGRIARPDPTRARGWDGQVTLTLEGSAGALDAFARAVPPTFLLSPGAGLRLETGTYEQDLREALAALEPFVSSGVTIRETDPPSIWVEVAEQDSADVPIELDLTGLTLDGSYTINPTRVTISGPRDVLRRLTPQSRARVTLTPADLARLVPGRAETLADIRVLPPAELGRDDLWGGSPISPATVSLTITLRAQSRELTISNVPVILGIAPVDYPDWDLQVAEADKFLQNIVLTGPRAAIDAYERGEWRIDAIVRLSFNELEAALTAGSLIRNAEIGPLPPGVTATCEDRRVEVLVRRRSGPTAIEPSAPDEN